MSGYQRIASIVLYVVAGISILMAGLYYFGGIVPEPASGYVEYVYTGQILLWSYILFIIATISTLVFSVVNVLSNPQDLKGFVITLGLSALFVGVSYFLASDELLVSLPDELKLTTTAATIKWTDAGLIATYILFVTAVAGILISEIVRAFR